MTKCECGRDKALLIGPDSREEVCCYCSLSEEAKKELEEIHKKTEKMLKPLYDDLGVDMKTEDLHWTNGEVFVINKKTRERREIGLPQKELNAKCMNNAIDTAIKIKADDKKQ